jgi:hypothetical protein
MFPHTTADMIRRLALASAAMILAMPATGRQDQTDLFSSYIDTQFQATIGEVPRLAWFLPDGNVVAQDTSPSIVVYSRSSTAHIAHLRNTLTQTEIAELRKTPHVACDLAPEGDPAVASVYSTLARPDGLNPQILSTGKLLPGLQAGFEKMPLRGRAESDVWKEMQPADASQPRLATEIRRRGVDFFYSVAALYGGPNKEVTRIGLFLHADSGKIMATHIGDIRGAWCDGCAMPTIADGIDRVYNVENMFTAPSFAYPMLMLDTTTVEGRSIELVTFTPAREYSRHLFYEYVVGCSD